MDVLTEQTRGTSRNDAKRFDGHFAPFTGETAKLLAGLVEALGGVPEGDPEVTRQAAGDEPVRP
ncbi:hypothetical protein D0T23_27860 [Duganella sp. BJB475]|nr:hypothetical protein D0T23_27860 [Duganella sp. BJB475]